MAIELVEPPGPGGGTQGGGGTAGNGVVPFTRTLFPPAPPVITPPVEPPMAPQGGGTMGTIGRGLTVVAPVVARRWPPIGIVAGIIGGLLIGWGLSNSQPERTKEEPQVKSPTRWSVKGGPGENWMVRMRGYGGEQFGFPNLSGWREWSYPRNKKVDGVFLPGDWGSSGATDVEYIGFREIENFPVPGYTELVIYVKVRVIRTDEIVEWSMADFGTAFEVEIKPLIHPPEGGQDFFPDKPRPYDPPPLELPDPNETKKDTKPKPPVLVPTPAGPIKQPAKPERLPEPDTTGDPEITPPPRPPLTKPADPNPTIPGSRVRPGWGSGEVKQPGPTDNNDPGPSKKPKDPAEPGPDNWEETEPTGDPERVKKKQAPGPTITTKTQTLLDDGTKLDPPPIPEGPPATQLELAKLEAKAEKILKEMPKTPDIGEVLALLRAILDLLRADEEGTVYSITAACPERNEDEPRTVEIPAAGGATIETAIKNRIDALAALVAASQLLTVKNCSRNTSTPTNNVTVTAFEVLE